MKTKHPNCVKSKECQTLICDTDFSHEKNCHKCDWNMDAREKEEFLKLMSETNIGISDLSSKELQK